MNVTGPAPISIVQRYDNTDVVLRMNQRFAAEVLQVTGDRVVLSVNGVQIVARMTSSEQAAQLIERRTAQFVVRDASANIVTLQLLPHGANAENLTNQQINALVKALLQQADLPLTSANITLARALLEHGLPVEASLLNQLNQILEQIAGWGEKEAQIAAAMVEDGLVLSPQLIQAFIQKLPDLGEVLFQLLNDLRKYIAANSENNTPLAQEALSFLQSFMLKLSDPQPDMISQLQRIMRVINHPLENALAELLKNSQAKLGDHIDSGFLSLLSFYHKLVSESNSPRIAQEIEQFIETLRLEQYFNLQSDPNNPKAQWYRITIPIQLDNHNSMRNNENHPQQVHLRIAYLPDQIPLQLDANHTRFMVQVEMKEGILEVDVSLAQHKVGVQVRANDLILLAKAKDEINSLQAGISALGYQIQNTNCELCELESFSLLEERTSKNWGEVSLGV
ncbi:MAG: hypothetical protein ACPL4H_04815 [Anaerolineales bacterium]